MTGVVTQLGARECEIEVREHWGIRVVVTGPDGKEKVVWGQELARCSKNHNKRDDPHQSVRYHKYNRHKLQGVKPGVVVSYPSGDKYVKSKVIAVVRAGCWQYVRYTVPLSKCIHKESVRCSKKMIDRARRDNHMWGLGLRPPPSQMTERHVVSAATFDHLRDWIFSTDFLEPVKASEQSTQRGHCFAVKEAATSTFPRYQKSADAAGVDAVSERIYRCVHLARI